LINRHHVGLYKIIENIRQEETKIEGVIERINMGDPRPLMTLKDKCRQERLETIMRNRRNGTLNTVDFLRGIANNLIY
jgi:hypothetical protein